MKVLGRLHDDAMDERRRQASEKRQSTRCRPNRRAGRLIEGWVASREDHGGAGSPVLRKDRGLSNQAPHDYGFHRQSALLHKGEVACLACRRSAKLGARMRPFAAMQVTAWADASRSKSLIQARTRLAEKDRIGFHCCAARRVQRGCHWPRSKVLPTWNNVRSYRIAEAIPPASDWYCTFLTPDTAFWLKSGRGEGFGRPIFRAPRRLDFWRCMAVHPMA